MNEEVLLAIKGVSKSFGGVKALDNVSFDITKGKSFGIIGPNGSGKTTLVNVITGFVKPDSGRILFKGKDITRFPPHLIADLGVTRTFQIMRP